MIKKRHQDDAVAVVEEQVDTTIVDVVDLAVEEAVVAAAVVCSMSESDMNLDRLE